MKYTLKNILTGLFALMLSWGVAPKLWACGGFFCSNSPVDQNAERVLFEVHDNGTITATVEISYTGDPGAFSWIVPVPDTPQLGIVSAGALRVLDSITRPVIIPPPVRCDPAPFADDSFAESADTDNNGVSVETLPQVGPFDPQVIESSDAQALIDWLNTNDYLISEEMEPFIDGYVDAGMKFLGLKLAPDSEVSDIAPIEMNYASTAPMIPLVLTAVAAEPEMGVIVFIAAEGRYTSDNFANLTVNPDEVQVQPNVGQSNYFPLISYMVDQAGGQAFVTEFSDSTDTLFPETTSYFGEDRQDAIDDVVSILNRHQHITRMYTRISGWEILADPSFSLNGELGPVSRTIDLSDREAFSCNDFDPVPCGDTYCGEGAECGTTDDESLTGCVCPSDAVARQISDPQSGGTMITCQRLNFDLMASLASRDDVEFSDPCLNIDCGSGDCLPLNGFATCACNEGQVAVNTSQGPECRTVKATFDASRLVEWKSSGCSGCVSGGSMAPLWGLAGLLFWRRRFRPG